MVTCFLQYQVVPEKLPEFEAYAAEWVRLVEKLGGCHHGYYLPHEGASDLAIALFSFPSLADYEAYRTTSLTDPECQAAYASARQTGCIVRYDRSFLRPLGEPGTCSLPAADSTTSVPGCD